MAKKYTVYCDICYEEIPSNCHYYKLTTRATYESLEGLSLDICSACEKALEDFISVRSTLYIKE